MQSTTGITKAATYEDKDTADSQSCGNSTPIFEERLHAVLVPQVRMLRADTREEAEVKEDEEGE